MNINRTVKQLAIPLEAPGGILYVAAEIKKPKSSVIADTQRARDGGNEYNALSIFIGGSIVTLIQEDDTIEEDSKRINSLMLYMPYRSAELLAIDIMLLVDSRDGIEGIYPCPLCGVKHIARKQTIGGQEVDTRDFISELDKSYMCNGTTSTYEPTFTGEFSEAIHIESMRENEGGIDLDVKSYKMKNPTLGHCIAAYTKYGMTDLLRLQNGIYIEALVEINGEAIDKKWKTRFGRYVFDNIADAREDLGAMANNVKKFGIHPYSTKFCTNCGNEWLVEVNTSNFFASALRPLLKTPRG